MHGQYVILTADPAITGRRIGQRGARSRFEAGIATSRTEADFSRDATVRLADRGHPLLALDTPNTPSTQVTAMIAGRIAHLVGVSQADTATA